MASDAIRALKIERKDIVRQLKMLDVVLEKLGVSGRRKARRKSKNGRKKKGAKVAAEKVTKPKTKAAPKKVKKKAAKSAAALSLEERRERARQAKAVETVQPE